MCGHHLGIMWHVLIYPCAHLYNCTPKYLNVHRRKKGKKGAVPVGRSSPGSRSVSKAVPDGGTLASERQLGRGAAVSLGLRHGGEGLLCPGDEGPLGPRNEGGNCDITVAGVGREQVVLGRGSRDELSGGPDPNPGAKRPLPAPPSGSSFPARSSILKRMRLAADDGPAATDLGSTAVGGTGALSAAAQPPRPHSSPLPPPSNGADVRGTGLGVHVGQMAAKDEGGPGGGIIGNQKPLPGTAGSEDEMEAGWVQCESCNKWRALPTGTKV